jgi:cell division protein ZapA
MNKISVSIEILGKTYQINCPEHEVDSLKKSAKMLEERMGQTRGNGVLLSHDKIAVITSLNLAHQILLLEQHAQQYTQSLHQRLQELQNKVDNALAQNAQMELASAE